MPLTLGVAKAVYGHETGKSHRDGNTYHDRSRGRHVDREFRPDGTRIDHEYGRRGKHVDHEYRPNGGHAAQIHSLVEEGKPFAEALREASIGRVRPKLMTALCAMLGLLPLLVLRLHGTEIERPLAIVMIGGLVTSTLFTLLVLPTFYMLAQRVRERFGTRSVSGGGAGT
ncbi:MAG: efflux RND transporter permease subunit [Candidatus Binatia bacterium]